MSSPISVAVPQDWIRNGRPATIVSASRTTDSGTTAIEIGLGIEDHRPRHLRLDGYGAANAERRTEAHVADQFIRACRHQDLVDSAVADGGHELAHGAHRDLGELSTTLYRKGSCRTSVCVHRRGEGNGPKESRAPRARRRRTTTHAQALTHKHSRTSTHTHTHTQTHTQTYANMHTHARARKPTHTHEQAQTRTSTHAPRSR